MTTILNLDEIQPHSQAIVGGKGNSLGELHAAGFSVPVGFVITTDMFTQFLQENHIVDDIQAIIDTVDHTVVHTIETASERVQALIEGYTLSEGQTQEITQAFRALGTSYVAVRSSATVEDGVHAAWAGQLDTFLNTTEETLIDHIKKCWASLYSPRALFYRFEKELHQEDISVAVVVQTMVQSEISGIAFSVHPVTEDHNQMVIEAGFGLGEAIVSGQVTPDSYVVTKVPQDIIDITVSNQKKALYREEQGGNSWKELGQKGKTQVLSETQVLELAAIVTQIESHYGFPCDIEWAFVDGMFYITQSRPITTLKGVNQKDVFKERFLTEEFTNTIHFSGKEYNLFFRNPLPPLVALYYADELFFHSFERLCGARYRIFSLIRSGEQQKYGLTEDIKNLKKIFLEKISDPSWPEDILEEYTVQSEKFRHTLDLFSKQNYLDSTNQELASDLGRLRLEASVLDAMSNMLHLFSALLGGEFLHHLQRYSSDKKEINENFEYYTQPIKESRFAKNVRAAFDARFVLDEYGSVFSRILRVGSFIKDDVSALLEERSLLSAGLFAEISKRIQCDAKDLEYLQVSEIQELLFQGNVSSALIQKRKDITVLYYEDRDLNVYEGDSALDLLARKGINNYFQKQKAREYSGQIAALGSAEGEIVVAKNHEEAIKNMVSNAILVAPYTDASYLPAMKLASGIITETSGITSHAAIIARELGIPCLVGVKDIVQMLSDGEKVKLDANEGKIILLSGQKATYKRSFSREYSLLGVELWDRSEGEYFYKMIGEEIPKEGNQFYWYVDGIAHNYVNMDEIDRVRNIIIGNIQKDPSWFEKVEKQFWDNQKIFDRLKKGEIVISSEEDFWRYYEVLSLLWGSYNVSYWLTYFPNEKIDPSVFKRAEHIRETEDALTDECDHLMRMAIETFRPGISPVLRPYVLTQDLFSKNLSVELKKRDNTIFFRQQLRAVSYDSFIEDQGFCVELNPEYLGEYAIKGQSVYQGKATGKVRLCYKKEHVKDVQDGDIMVSYMTSPDYLPAMQRAAAYVTDEGGMMCHAAILARELKKPCVVGTQIATDFLKNGDLVEVDGDSGVVRKLSIEKNKRLHKFLTRDASLIALEHWWYKGFEDQFTRFFGFPFTKIVFVHRNGIFVSYKDDQYLNEQVVPQLKEFFSNNKSTITEVETRLVHGNQIFDEIMQRDYASLAEVKKDLYRVCTALEEGCLAVFVVHRIPIIHDQMKQNGNQFLDKQLFDSIVALREGAGNTFFSKGVQSVYFLLSQISKLCNWDEALLKHICLRELEDALHVGVLNCSKELAERKRREYALLNGEVRFDFVEKLYSYGYQFDKARKKLGTIQGTTANKGRVKGKVVVVSNQTQLNMVEDGDILVAPMTTEWYTRVMDKVSGIITDEGGITCHAAIISREYNVPCIIGTNIATEVLKNGDLVELDADRGIVKKL